MVDCDELWWPRYAEAWYEPGMAPERFRGKAPKDKKSWKNAYLAAKPEDGPTAEEVARREAKVKKREEMLARWREENLGGERGAARTGGRGRGRGGAGGFERQGGDAGVLQIRASEAEGEVGARLARARLRRRLTMSTTTDDDDDFYGFFQPTVHYTQHTNTLYACKTQTMETTKLRRG